MDRLFFTVLAVNIPELDNTVNKFLVPGTELVGGPFSHAGMVCQAMMMTIHEEDEDEPVTCPENMESVDEA